PPRGAARGRRAARAQRLMDQPPDATPAGDGFGPPPSPPPPPTVDVTPLPPLPPIARVPAYGYPAYAAPAPVLPPVSEAVLRIPLGTRELVRQALDLLTRSDSGLRGPSFYIGFFLLVTFGPLAVILGLVLALGQDVASSPDAYGPPPAWLGALLFAF